MRTTVLAALAAVSLALPARAQTTTIGASLTTSVGPLSRGTGAFQSFGQTFVVPPITTRLSTFTLSFSNFFNGSALRFDAYLYAFDVANRRVTGSALLNFLNVSGSTNDFAFDQRTFNAGNLTLSAGATYMFLVTTSNQGGVPTDASNLVGANDTFGYNEGAFWVAYNGANFGALGTAGAFTEFTGVSDAAFSAVFAGAQQVVPEPESIALTAIGLIGVGGLVRRRRGATV